MKAAMYFCITLSVPPLKRTRGRKGRVMSPPTDMTVIVVPVNGTLSYVELPLSRPQQLVGVRRINLPRFSQLTHFLSSMVFSFYYRFTVYTFSPPKTPH